MPTVPGVGGATGPTRSPLDEVAAGVVGGFDLDGGVADLVTVAEDLTRLVEHRVHVGVGTDLEVDAHRVHAGGDGPHVEVMGVLDVRDRLEVGRHVADVDVGRRELDEETAELLNTRLGSDLQLVPKAELRREIGSDVFHGGMVDSKSASLHVGKYIRGLGEAAERAGVTIHENAPVVGLTKLGSGHELETPRGRIKANQVLLATGAYTRRPFRWHQVRIAPVGSFIIATEPLGASVCDDLLPTRRVASDSKNLLNYFRITPDNRLLFGGRARFAMSNPQSDEKSGKLLRDAMVHVFPQLTDAKIDYCWGGVVDMTLDRMVKAGQRDGVYYSMGYAGHGVQMATYMGRQMADYMSGVPEANIWSDFEFRRIPGHFGPPWFLPFAGAYYKFKDRVS